MALDDIADIVDLDRYPLHRPDSVAEHALLCAGRAALKNRALFTLPGFVRSQAVAAMAGELEALVPAACRYQAERYCYTFDGNAWPTGHPRATTHLSRYHQVLNHQISNDSPLRRLYCWEPLREFLRRLMGYDTFYRSECPHLALSSKIACEGDVDGWHFDSNDVVFSVLLQRPEGGGHFEYVPYIRTDQDENYDAVAAVFEGQAEDVQCAELSVGDLNVFQGDQTLHRVSPVHGRRRRIVALFCYDREPGTNFGEPYIEELRRCMPATKI